MKKIIVVQFYCIILRPIKQKEDIKVEIQLILEQLKTKHNYTVIYPE